MSFLGLIDKEIVDIRGEITLSFWKQRSNFWSWWPSDTYSQNVWAIRTQQKQIGQIRSRKKELCISVTQSIWDSVRNNHRDRAEPAKQEHSCEAWRSQPPCGELSNSRHRLVESTLSNWSNLGLQIQTFCGDDMLTVQIPWGMATSPVSYRGSCEDRKAAQEVRLLWSSLAPFLSQTATPRENFP